MVWKKYVLDIILRLHFTFFKLSKVVLGIYYYQSDECLYWEPCMRNFYQLILTWNFTGAFVMVSVFYLILRW